MKKILLFIVLFVVNIGAYAQVGNIKGTVQYEFNDYVGYKIDVGAEVTLIPYEIFNSAMDIDKWKEYEYLGGRYMFHLEIKYENDMDDWTASKFSKFDDEKSERLKVLSKEMLESYMSLLFKSDSFLDISIVDNSGLYTMTDIPYGKYVLLFKSKNRNRPITVELANRLHFEVIEINKKITICSYDFDY